MALSTFDRSTSIVQLSNNRSFNSDRSTRSFNFYRSCGLIATLEYDLSTSIVGIGLFNIDRWKSIVHHHHLVQHGMFNIHRSTSIVQRGLIADDFFVLKR